MRKEVHQCFCNSISPYICEMLMNIFQLDWRKRFSKEYSLYLNNCYTSKQQWCPCRSPLNDALIHTFTLRLWRLILPSLCMHSFHKTPTFCCYRWPYILHAAACTVLKRLERAKMSKVFINTQILLQKLLQRGCGSCKYGPSCNGKSYCFLDF